MKGVVGTKVALAVLVVAAGMIAACGGGGGGGTDEDPTGATTATTALTSTPAALTPTPAQTSTPSGPTATDTDPGATPSDGTPTANATPAGGTPSNVAFDITSAEALFGFQFTVTYPTGKGAFHGSANLVSCATPSREIFTKNDKDDGNLILSLANIAALAFPVHIDCRFDVFGGQVLTPADVVITGTEVTDETGAVGDPATLAVAIGVS